MITGWIDSGVRNEFYQSHTRAVCNSFPITLSLELDPRSTDEAYL